MRILFALSLLVLAIPPTALAQEQAKKATLDADVKEATGKALDWLAKQQNPDGSWSDGRYPHNTAVTGFALMAFMSQGHLPNKGKYGPEVAKGARYLVGVAREDGYMVGARGSGAGNMYCHGMATLALTQLFGMTGDEDIKKVLKRAVELTVRSQADNGGWRYNPFPSDADISVTIMQVMALRGAKDSGINVPEKTFKKALEYIDTCYDDASGGYTYQPKNRSPGFARTAAGICVLKLVGEYERKTTRAVEYIKKKLTERSHEHFWYGHYYASHAMHQVGGKDWDEYYANIRKMFLGFQAADGSVWGARVPQEGVGPVYQTSIMVIALSVPANYLPIFQR